MLRDDSAPLDNTASSGPLSRRRLLRIGTVGVLGSTAAAALAACGESQVVTVEKVVTQTQIKEVPVEKIVTQTVVKEVQVDKVVPQTVIKEVPGRSRG